MASKPLFNVLPPVSLICHICQKEIKKKEKHRTNVDFSGKLCDLAKKWKNLRIPENDRLADFPLVYDRISNLEKGNLHESCRLEFGTKLKKYSQFEIFHDDEPEIAEASVDSSILPKPFTRSDLASHTQTVKKDTCVICAVYKENEGTSRITEEDVAKRLLSAKDLHLKNLNSQYHIASKRLDLKLKGSVHDIFAADIFYHNRCLQNISYIPKSSDKDPMIDLVVNHFFEYVKLKICHEKNAYLLHDLLQDAISMSDDYNIESIFTNTKSLRRKLEQLQGISFYKSSKYVIVYPNDVDPLMYSEAILRGNGLRTTDLTAAFAKFVHRIVKDNPISSEWPKPYEELISGLKSDRPLSILYNVIYMTMYTDWISSVPLNEDGFAKTISQNIANKIWSIAADWTSLITGQKLSKQISLALLIHRLSPKKEIINILNKSGHAMSYNDLCLQNKHWETQIESKHGILCGMIPGVSTHFAFDNNDLSQETLTGKNTSHHTNFIMFQPSPPKIDNRQTVISNTVHLNISTSDALKNSNFRLNKKTYTGPNLFPTYKDKESTDLITQCFKKDMLWSLAGGLPNSKDLPLLGSWTSFMKQTSNDVATESLLKYLPANENPPDYPVCKDFMEFILEVCENLDLPRVFLHADEQVYARIMHTIWKNKEKFKCIIPLMGGFHQLRNLQILLGKRHKVFGYQEWYSDSEIIAKGSAANAFEGKHYYRSMRIHKEGFDALSQIRIEKISENYQSLSPQLYSQLVELRRKPTGNHVNEVLRSEEFNSLFDQYSSAENQRSKVVLAYLKDISLMLSLLSAVREGKIDRHLQAERQFLKLVFAFDHSNYARYNTYQHVLLTNMRDTNNAAYEELKKNGFGCTRTDKSTFSTKHGDLECEHFNRETKGTSGPFRSGYSTDINYLNKWIKTSHIHSELRNSMKKHFRLYTSSIHKELRPSNKKRHQQNVISLKKQIESYNVQLFDDTPVVNLVTGQEIDKNIVDGLVNASNKGDIEYQKFVKERLVSGKISFFSTIHKNNINRGIENKVKTSKKIDIIIEEKKALGLIVSMIESKEEAFSFPLTTYPLSISNPDGSLYSSEKASFRNLLIGDFFENSPYKNATWIVDAGYAIRQIKSRERYREYFEDLLKWMIPQEDSLPSKLIIAIDDYRTESTKDDERRRRRGGKDEGKRIHLTGTDQKMPPNSVKWSDFLTNGENKNDLMLLFIDFLKSDFATNTFKGMPVIICSKTEIYEIGSLDVEERLKCNHEEADTKIPLLASLCSTNVIAVATDCDVLVLLIYMFAKKQPKFQWHMKFERDKFANISSIVNKLGKSNSLMLPQYHALSGCDTTSFFFSKGKTNPFKKALSSGSLSLLETLGSTDKVLQITIDSCTEFIRSVVYNGKAGETYLETRIRSYIEQPLDSKTTRRIPPDLDSCRQHILRSHYSSFVWTHCDNHLIPDIDACLNGWKSEGSSLFPVWFVGSQYPVGNSKSQAKNFDVDASVENEVVENGTSKMKKRKKKKTRAGYKFRRMINQIDFDDDLPLNLEEQIYSSSSDDAEDEIDVNNTVDEDFHDSDDWERLSDFVEVTTSDSSDSDW